jgi:hypothetical protein
MKLTTNELLSTLWNKLYPLETNELLSEVYKIFCYFWNENNDDLLFGNQINYLTPTEYWSMVKMNSQSQAYIIASDFALRLVSSGITSCSVERTFSYIRWLLGEKRYLLSKEALQNLITLKLKK